MLAISEKRSDCIKQARYRLKGLNKGHWKAQCGQTFAQQGNPNYVARVDDKHLTPHAKTCDNICRKYEDFMARQNGRGSSRPRALIRSASPSNLSPVLAPNCPSRFLLRFSSVLGLLLILVASGFAQDSDVQDIHLAPRIETPKPAPDALEKSLGLRAPMIRSKVDLVLVPVTVTDPMNRLVTGLDKENFQVFEGKERQEVRNFSSEDAPVSLGIIFDMSGSMSSKIERAREAVGEFFKTANPQDEFFIVAFADKPEEVSDFTQSVDDLQGKLIFTVPKGRTALLDAIYLGISKMRQAKYPKKALLIISDGGDNHSRYTEGEIKSLVKEADVMIYSIGIYDHYFQTEEERLGPALLSDISDL